MVLMDGHVKVVNASGGSSQLGESPEFSSKGISGVGIQSSGLSGTEGTELDQLSGTEMSDRLQMGLSDVGLSAVNGAQQGEEEEEEYDQEVGFDKVKDDMRVLRETMHLAQRNLADFDGRLSHVRGELHQEMEVAENELGVEGTLQAMLELHLSQPQEALMELEMMGVHTDMTGPAFGSASRRMVNPRRPSISEDVSTTTGAWDAWQGARDQDLPWALHAAPPALPALGTDPSKTSRESEGPDAHELSEMSRTLLAQDIGDMLKNTQVS